MMGPKRKSRRGGVPKIVDSFSLAVPLCYIVIFAGEDVRTIYTADETIRVSFILLVGKAVIVNKATVSNNRADETARKIARIFKGFLNFLCLIFLSLGNTMRGKC